MITQWDDLVGHEITGVYLACYGTVLLLDDNEFAVLVGTPGYEDDVTATLADADDEEALGAAVLVDAPGARRLRDKVRVKWAEGHREAELRSLAYLQKKYPDRGVKDGRKG